MFSAISVCSLKCVVAKHPSSQIYTPYRTEPEQSKFTNYKLSRPFAVLRPSLNSILRHRTPLPTLQRPHRPPLTTFPLRTFERIYVTSSAAPPNNQPLLLGQTVKWYSTSSASRKLEFQRAQANGGTDCSCANFLRIFLFPFCWKRSVMRSSVRGGRDGWQRRVEMTVEDL